MSLHPVEHSVSGAVVSHDDGTDAHRTRRAPTKQEFHALLAALALCAASLGALLLHTYLPSRQETSPTRLYPALLQAFAGLGVLSVFALRVAALRRLVLAKIPLVAAGVVILAAWDLCTLKFALVPLPYFPGPDMVLQSLADNWLVLLEATGRSLLLLTAGYAAGSLAGVACGVVIGWSSRARYWGMPALKLVGPIPATALVPLALLLFPSAFVSGMMLIAVAVWFPVTMLTASGIANVHLSYIDVARTLGAGRAYLVFRVAIPAALPSIFIGLFMGLGASFLTLIVAETVGAKSGLGWFIDWAKIWADYAKVYAALIIMAAFFSGIMTLLFKVRDRVLVWQKGVIRW